MKEHCGICKCRVWGSVCLLVAFVWQLYTIILLLLLHESVPGIRYSRYLFLAMAAFGIYIHKQFPLFFFSRMLYFLSGRFTQIKVVGVDGC